MPALDHVSWSVNYEPGIVECKGYDRSGTQVVTQSISTTGPVAAIQLSLDLGQNGLQADGQDVALVAVALVDSNGKVVPTAGNLVSFSVTGPGKLIGLGSGDPSNHQPDKGTERNAWKGAVRAIVQSDQQPGTIVLHASAAGLPTAQLSIPSTTPKSLYLSI